MPRTRPAVRARRPVPLGPRLLLVVLPFLLFWRVLTPNALDRTLLTHGDFLSFFLPTQLHLSDRLHEGAFPWWNAVENGGQPFAADGQTGALYLPRLLAALVASPWHPYAVAYALAAVQLAHVALAGLGLFCLLRWWGAGVAGAVFAGIAWELSHTVVGRFGHVPAQLAWCWLPWAVLGFDRAMADGGARRIGLAGATLALLVMCGFVQVSWIAGLLLAWLLIWRTGEALGHAGPAGATRIVGRFALAGLATALLAAPLLVPGLEFARLANRAVRPSLEYAATFAGPARFLLREMLLPDIARGEGGGYAGLVTLVVAAFGFPLVRRREKWWLAAAAAAGAMIAVGGTGPWLGPLYYWWAPVVLRAPVRAIALTTFGAAVLGGFGLDALLAAGDRPLRRRLARALPWAGVGLVAAVGGFLAVMLLRPVDGLDPGSLPAENLDLAAAAAVLGAVALAALGVLLSDSARARPGAAWLLVGLLVVDLFGAGYLRYSAQAPRVYPGPAGYVPAVARPTWAEALRRRDATGLDDPSFANIAPYFQRRASPTGYNPLQLKAYAEVMLGRPMTVSVGTLEAAFDVRRLPRPLRRLLGMDGGVLDRLFLATRVEGGLAPSVLLARLHDPAFDPGHALLEAPVPTELVSGKPAGGSIELGLVTPERLECSVESRGPNLLVFVDNDFPGWQVTVDGARTPLLRVDHTFKGVVVAAGQHHATFVYRPFSGWLGLTIGALAWLALIATTFIRNPA